VRQQQAVQQARGQGQHDRGEGEGVPGRPARECAAQQTVYSAMDNGTDSADWRAWSFTYNLTRQSPAPKGPR